MVLDITLGDASSVVIVVLIMVVKAAIAITPYHASPKFEVYNSINCPANSLPLLENSMPESNMTIAPKPTKQIPKTTVVK